LAEASRHMGPISVDPLAGVTGAALAEASKLPALLDPFASAAELASQMALQGAGELAEDDQP
jgi:hypothetical protein